MRPMMMSRLLVALPLLLTLVGLQPLDPRATVAPEDEALKRFLVEYAAYAHASYSEVVVQAERLRVSLDAFLAKPSKESLAVARKAWIQARDVYGTTEVLRFYEGPIDNRVDGPETFINAWPVDESYIDAVKGRPNSGIVNDSERFPVLAGEILVAANQQGGEAHVCLGWHAIEFMLWGQDLFADGPGRRSHEDFLAGRSPATERRREYLEVVADRLLQDLKRVRDSWEPKKGAYRKTFLTAEPRESLRCVLKGMLVLSGFEMAGERMAVALENQDQEDEHSCFSDTTHRDFVANQSGIVAVWTGEGRGMSRHGLRSVTRLEAPDLSRNLDRAIKAATAAVGAIPAPFDQAIMGDDEGPGRKAVLAAVVALEDQADAIAGLGLKLGFVIPMKPGQ